MSLHLLVRLLCSLGAAMCSMLSASAAILSTNDFAASAEGWEAGSANMSVSWTSDEGNTPESLEGSFAAQGIFFIPQEGSFRIDQAGNDFLGEYPGTDFITGFTFDFMAATVLPMDLSLNLYSGSDVYFIALDLTGMGLNTWKSFTVSLSDPDWTGEANVLANVDAIEVTVGRGSAAAQSFYLDNFATTAEDMGGGGEGGESVIPEPATLMMFGGAWVVLYAMRRKVRQQAACGEGAA